MSASMHVVIVNRFFWPDHSATSQLATDLATHLVASGHRVTAVTSRQLYDEPKASLPPTASEDGITIRRIWTTRLGRRWLPGRAVDYATFYLMCFLALLRIARPGVVVVAKTDPPLISVIAALACRFRGGRLVTWQQDLFPEVAAALGMRWAAGPIGHALRWLRNRSLGAADMNVALNDRMTERLITEGVPSQRVRVIPNWCDPGIHPVLAAKNPLRQAWGLGDQFVIGYSGNLGRAHMPEAVAELVRRTWNLPNLAWVFIGGGAGLDHIRQVVAETGATNVQFRPYQPRDRLSQSLSVPDLHLVSLDPACEGLIMPSKLYGILAAGRPVLFLGDPDGSVAREIAVNDLGNVLPGDGPEHWESVVRAFLCDPARCRMIGGYAQECHVQRYHPERVRSAWLQTLEDAANVRALEFVPAPHRR